MGITRKQSTPNFPKNEHFLPADAHKCVCVLGGKKCSFFGKFDVLCFLVTPVLGFALLIYRRRNEYLLPQMKQNSRQLKYQSHDTKIVPTKLSQNSNSEIATIKGKLNSNQDLITEFYRLVVVILM